VPQEPLPHPAQPPLLEAIARPSLLAKNTDNLRLVFSLSHFWH
jgi:hypothetical protein